MSGAIRGYRALVDDRLLGKRMTVYIRVTLERQSAPVLSAFEAAVRHCKEIVSCHLMAGSTTTCWWRGWRALTTMGGCTRTSFRACPGVTRLETSFALRDVLDGSRV